MPNSSTTSGAGVSAESGIPTFRGVGGLWRSMEPGALATPQAFVRRPSLVWEFYSWRREVAAACRPNRAHHAIAALERRLAAEGRGVAFTLITQNVGRPVGRLRTRPGRAPVGLPGRAARSAAQQLMPRLGLGSPRETSTIC